MLCEPEDIAERIAHFAGLRPDAPAVYHRDQVLSYQELHEASGRLAKSLLAAGVKPGSIVGVCTGVRFDLVIAMAAVFRCKAVYLPLDPQHPVAHNESILEESQPAVVLTHRETVGKALPTKSRVQTASESPPAYLMYTSGTTGKPKAVVLSTGNLRHYLSSAQRAFGFVQDDVFCNIARPTFSISLFDLALPLTVGAAVRLVDRDEVFDPPLLLQRLARSTVLHAGPSLLATLFRYLRTSPDQAKHLQALRHVSTGGDLVLPAVMEGMKEFFPSAELFVIYGTTEISCMGTYFPIPRDRRVERALVGKPFPGVGLTLVDGEICFSGPGVQTESLYHTGDYGRFDANGDLEMLGRRDFQVQLRGVRIELTAIENQIVEAGFASHCVVIHRRTDEDSGCLVAFLAGAPCHDPEAVRQALAAKLPAEMVPSRCIFLEALPTNFNGKLDRRKLHDWPIPVPTPAPEGGNAAERAVGAVIGARLGRPALGPEEDFFANGGHSLLAILVLDDLRRTLAMTIQPAVFFADATPRALARCVRTPSTAACHVVPLTSCAGRQPLYCIAGVHTYTGLARSLGPAWSPFGVFTEAECNPSAVAPAALEDLARDYTQAILAQQAKGPYYILGFSFGGIVAFEVGRQLRAAGHSVQRIFLLDAILPEKKRRWQRPLRIARVLLTTSPVSVLAFLRERKRGVAVPGQPDPTWLPLERERDHRNAAIAADYVRRIPKYRGNVTLVVAGGRLGRTLSRSSTCGWRPHASRLDVVRTTADHGSLLGHPRYLREISQVIDHGFT